MTNASAAGSSGPPDKKSVATRAALVELAAEMFARNGYIETSIRDIARHGGVSTGAIYGHFRNKADLLVAAIAKRTAEELDDRWAQLGEDPDYEDVIQLLAHEKAERRALRALLVLGAAAAQTDVETRDELRAQQLEYIGSWVDAYAAHQQEICLDPAIDTHTLVLHTWALELGLGVLEAIGIEPDSTDQWAEITRRTAEAVRRPSARRRRMRRT